MWNNGIYAKKTLQSVALNFLYLFAHKKSQLKFPLRTIFFCSYYRSVSIRSTWVYFYLFVVFFFRLQLALSSNFSHFLCLVKTLFRCCNVEHTVLASKLKCRRVALPYKCRSVCIRWQCVSRCVEIVCLYASFPSSVYVCMYYVHKQTRLLNT